MLKVLRVELMKLQWLLIGSLAIGGPAFAVLLGVNPTTRPGVDAWTMAYTFATMRYAWLFYPLLAGVFAALVCRTEHVGGGWKQLLTLPVTRSQVYLAKSVVLAGALALTNLAFGAVFVAAGMFAHIPGPVPWATIGLSLLSGWVAVLPLAAVQLLISSRWRSFGAALALNVCFTLPAIFAAQSGEIGPWYPWAQPMLAMTPAVSGSLKDSLMNVAPATFWVVIVGGFAVAMVGGLVTFARADVRG